jgi:hypothetical protein
MMWENPYMPAKTYGLTYDYTFDDFRAQHDNWPVGLPMSEETTKAQFGQWYADAEEGEWKRVRFYHAWYWLHKLAHEHPEDLREHYRPSPSGDWFSDALVFAIYSLMAHLRESRIGDYPPLDVVLHFANQSLQQSNDRARESTGPTKAAASSAWPKYAYTPEEFGEQMTYWLSHQPATGKEYDRYFLHRYPVGEARWKSIRMQQAILALKEGKPRFQDFMSVTAEGTQYSPELICGLWRYYGAAPEQRLVAPPNFDMICDLAKGTPA